MTKSIHSVLFGLVGLFAIPAICFGGMKVDSQSGGVTIGTPVTDGTADTILYTDSGGVTASGISYSGSIKRQLTITLDGGGSVLAVGGKDIGLRAPYDMTVNDWQLVSYPSTSTGTVSVDVWGCAFGSFPTATDTLVGSSTPTVTSSNISSGTFSSPIALTEGMMLDVSILAGVAVSTRAVLSLGGTVE